MSPKKPGYCAGIRELTFRSWVKVVGVLILGDVLDTDYPWFSSVTDAMCREVADDSLKVNPGFHRGLRDRLIQEVRCNPQVAALLFAEGDGRRTELGTEDPGIAKREDCGVWSRSSQLFERVHESGSYVVPHVVEEPFSKAGLSVVGVIEAVEVRRAEESNVCKLGVVATNRDRHEVSIATQGANVLRLSYLRKTVVNPADDASRVLSLARDIRSRRIGWVGDSLANVRSYCARAGKKIPGEARFRADTDVAVRNRHQAARRRSWPHQR